MQSFARFAFACAAVPYVVEKVDGLTRLGPGNFAITEEFTKHRRGLFAPYQPAAARQFIAVEIRSPENNLRKFQERRRIEFIAIAVNRLECIIVEAFSAA